MAVRRIVLAGFAAVTMAAALLPLGAAASVPGADVRLTNDHTAAVAADGYVSNYTAVTGNAYTDATLTECSRSRGRQNEPSAVIDL